MKRCKLTPNDVAILTGLSAQKIREDLKSGVSPIGYATPPTENGCNWDYTISPIRLMMYFGIKKSAIEQECNVDLSNFEDISFVVTNESLLEVKTTWGDELIEENRQSK